VSYNRPKIFPIGAYWRLTSVELFVKDDDELLLIKQWCLANINKQYEFVCFHDRPQYLRILTWFASKPDATLFKLTWKSS